MCPTGKEITWWLSSNWQKEFWCTDVSLTGTQDITFGKQTLYDWGKFLKKQTEGNSKNITHSEVENSVYTTWCVGKMCYKQATASMDARWGKDKGLQHESNDKGKNITKEEYKRKKWICKDLLRGRWKLCKGYNWQVYGKADFYWFITDKLKQREAIKKL